MALPSFDSVAFAVLFISTEGVALSVLFISKEGVALSESFITKEWIRPSPVHREMCMHSRYQSDVPTMAETALPLPTAGSEAISQILNSGITNQHFNQTQDQIKPGQGVLPRNCCQHLEPTSSGY